MNYPTAASPPARADMSGNKRNRASFFTPPGQIPHAGGPWQGRSVVAVRKTACTTQFADPHTQARALPANEWKEP